MESIRKDRNNTAGRRRYQQNAGIQSKKIPIDDKIRIKISPREIDYNKSFTEEIPEQFRYKEYMDNLIKSVNQNDEFAAEQQSAWWNICEDAKRLDENFVYLPIKSIVLKDEEKSRIYARNLKNHSISYLDKYKDNIENEDYDGEDNKKLVTTKLSLIARKMINKVVYQYENSGYFNGKDDKGNDIKEGAKDVNLVLGKKIEDGKVIENSRLQYKDCKYQELFEHEPTARDCRQEYLGDCWLQAMLIDILTKRGSKPIKDMFKDEGDSGYVRVRLYYPKNRISKGRKLRRCKWRWEPKYYRVPKKIPVKKVNNKPIYNSGANWVHYLQAAVAKSGIRDKVLGKDLTFIDPATCKKTRNYASNRGGWSWFGWPMILGGSIKASRYNQNQIDHKLKAEIFDEDSQAMLEKTEQDKEDSKEQINPFYNIIKKALNDKKLITIGFDPATLKHKDSEVGISGGERKDRGLATRHAHAVIGAEEIDGVKYIRLINPWDTREGREYIDYKNGKKGDKGKKRGALFRGKGDESFLLKATTVHRHLGLLEIGNV